MENYVKSLITAIVAALGLTVLPAAAQSSFPSKPITIIVPFAAGSGTDVLARALTVSMAHQLNGASFVIDNRPGANGIIAASAAANAMPDGYTLFLTTNTTHSVNPVLYRKLPYDPNTDFVPIGLLGETAPALLAAANNPANTVKAMIELGKQRPAGLNFATANTSSLAATQLLQSKTGIKLAIANYKSAPQALTDLTGGTIDFFFGDLASGGALVRGGKLKALAVLSDKRLPGFVQVPTVAEAGYPGMEILIWIGLFAPKGTPGSLVERLNTAMVAAQKQPELVRALADAAVNVRATKPDEFASYVASQYVRWAKLAKEINLQME
jgi:tripartite-type tricarboxylate transporter receptor subunit TctC